MNKFALLPIFLLLLISAAAQDKIISINNDTIHCRIISIGQDRIMYELNNNDGTVTGKFIPLSQVAEYLNSHQQEINLNTGEKEKPRSGNVPEKPLCLGFNSGISTMPWYLDYYSSSSSSSTILPDYYNKLKTGFHINASAHYMVNRFLGLGVEYSYYKTSTSGSFPGASYNATVFLEESEKYNQHINYLGISALFQQHLDAQRKFTINEYLSAGILFLRLEYQNTYPSANGYSYTDVSTNMLLTGKSFSVKSGLTVEYRVFNDISVGLGGNFVLSSIKKASMELKGYNNYSYSVENQELSSNMKLSRIDYTFVLHYYF
ncbi:MAG TPA: hypothetical protein PLS44_02320 [Candidatus Cloacimonas sp.]|nr:hypothetical protein [Candidatus Cloacimonas sp.]